ncbi:ASCH domain-containing protein [Kineococcus radiotolerans]|uniref:CMP/dCMP deaminase zinc-binding n=1 Tax=Kineococcus radiotolerans (strain ATCC BAA-149 / DSM 14245 / SRS30216) TaxID=266940 RepID=A6WAN1_KINRD|nr:ASCH domain-containing protein [Kineococcus radiotolerans]ABS03870.1 CMP/dCMP deaminase zinc-binding [Kineococcus radiotolerans SRS30216 = ATCC BAA-149]
MITDPVGPDAVPALIDAAREHGDGNIHTVAAAVLDEHDRIHVGLNLYHFTGGPCAELVALATARTAGAQAPRLIVAVGDEGRGVLAPCGRDRQVLADYYPTISVVVPTPDRPQVVGAEELLPHTYRWQAQQVQRLRFRASHLPAVRDGSKRATLRLDDPVQVGPALLVFEPARTDTAGDLNAGDVDDEVTLAGRITSTTAKTVAEISDEEAREDGFADAASVLPGLRNYYPHLSSDDYVVLVRFDVDES